MNLFAWRVDAVARAAGGEELHVVEGRVGFSYERACDEFDALFCEEVPPGSSVRLRRMQLAPIAGECAWVTMREGWVGQE